MGMPLISASGTTVCQALTDILESIALQEAALSHIVNTEGELLQKLVCMTITYDQLLAANTSVESMLNTISSCEIALKEKMEHATSLLTCGVSNCTSR